MVSMTQIHQNVNQHSLKKVGIRCSPQLTHWPLWHFQFVRQSKAWCQMKGQENVIITNGHKILIQKEWQNPLKYVFPCFWPVGFHIWCEPCSYGPYWDHLCKWTPARIDKLWQDTIHRLHTNQTKWTLGSAVLGSRPGSLMWKPP